MMQDWIYNLVNETARLLYMLIASMQRDTEQKAGDR